MPSHMQQEEENKLLSFPLRSAESWIQDYIKEELVGKSEKTVDVYQRILRQFTSWLAFLPGHHGQFHPVQITRSTVELYDQQLAQAHISISHRNRIKSVLSGFCRWLIDEKEVLTRNPTRRLVIPPQQQLAPRVLSEKQRTILRMLAANDDDPRGEAIFSLGYWAGCRVSDISHLLVEHTHVGKKIGWLHVGYKGGKWREIDLVNEARGPLYEYLHSQARQSRESVYVFVSQRNPRLSEDGIHVWFQKLRARATKDQWDEIANITFHDLRHDFAHRAREAGWTLEEVAYYLGHVTNKGAPAIQTTARYTQVSREQVKEKLKALKG